MTEINTAAEKPESILINYSTTRATELKVVYGMIEQHGECPRSKLVEKFGRRRQNGGYETDQLEDTIRFLHAVDMIDRPEDGVVRPINRDIHPNLSFESKLLTHLRHQSFPQDHLWKIYGVALDKGGRTITLDQLLPEVERQLDDYDFSWNKEKLRMWRELMRQTGVITETDEEGIILSPCRALLHELLATYREEHSDDLYEVLRWIEENFLQLFKTRVGAPEVHPAISDVLQNMEDDDVLSFRAMTDAQHEVKLPASNFHPNSRRVKLFDVEPQKDRIAYRYPLDQEQLEVSR